MGQGLGLVFALVLLNVSLAFGNIWPTPAVQWHGELSVELACVVLGLALAAAAGWRPSSRAMRALAVVWVLLIIGRYADVTVQSLFGREINLYWDSRHFSAVGAMLAVVARPWLVVLFPLVAILLPFLLFVVCRWALRCVARSMDRPLLRRTLAAVAIATLVLAVVQHREEPFSELPQFAAPVTPVFARQARLLAEEVSGINRPVLAPAPAIDSDFSRVQGADVFVIFLESYGATSWDRPEFVERLRPARERFAASIHDSGRDVVSAYALSPTFGGSSWLAHVSLLSGTEVRDGDMNLRLMAEPHRDTLVTAFKRHGYQAVAVMPGLQQVWPEGRFYGFDSIYGVKELDYHGPSFGWWDVTDQYTLAKLDQLAVQKQPRPPLFVFFPTISTHTPFLPVPPYQPDWSRMFDRHPYDAQVLDDAWGEQPDWLDLGPGYTKALTYSFDTIGGYLRLRHDRDFVVVVIGDHQPPAVVSGEGSSWEVPVHVIASRPELLERLDQHGFRPGLEPMHHPTTPRIDELMPVLLDAFGDRQSD
jgi:hypothetical protein